MNYKNYQTIGSEYIEELHAHVYHLEHEKTKAKILLLDNKNNNKSFSIGFRTPPTDSTGVAHIVEHSTLSGSRKYKTREPFMDMISSSLQTFLNAMTYPDKTIYPISSRNMKDFKQLMDLYLDSVFYPVMYEKKEIFLQEGWHEEIQNDQLIYNGVVYNEMKGVYSDPANQVSDLIRENLHPSGTYHHDSGGNPKNIPDLTYEDFLAFHKRYYHPSNSYILLAGDLDFEERLAYLDKEYLSNFEYLEPISNIIGHPAYKEIQEIKEEYSISEEEYSPDKNYFAMSWNIKDNPSPEDILLRSFFSELLIESDNAILKKILLEKGIGQDIYSELSTSNTLDFTIFAYHAKKEKYQEFLSVVMESLKNLVDNGIEKKELEATLNKFEFSVRQGGGAHRDIISYLGALNTWLYGADPIQGLKISSILKSMREKIQTDFYEKTITKWFLQTQNQVHGFIEPKIGKHEKEDRILKEKLSQRKESLTTSEIQDIKNQQNRLVAFQMAEDSQAAKDTIPKLEIDDLSKDIPSIPRSEFNLSNVKGTFNNQPTKGILYTSLAFDMSHLSLNEMRDASILSDLLTRLDTVSYDRNQLNQEIFLNTGGISVETPVEIHKDNTSYTPYIFIRVGTLADKLEEGLNILKEILLNTKFDNEKAMLEILYSTKSDLESSILQSAHSISMARVKSYFHEGSYVTEYINGLDLYFYLSSLLENFNFEEYSSRLKNIYKKLFSKSTLTFNLVGEETNLENAKNALSNFLSTLDTKQYEKHEIEFSPNPRNEAFLSSSLVNYVAKGYDLNLMDQSFQGELAVLGNLLSNKYLHYNIRAKGGAYGAGINFARSGQVATYSYRDPNLANTIEVYNGMGNYLRDLKLNDRDLTDLIIGTMNSFDPHLPPHSLGLLDFKRYLNGIEKEDVLNWKNQALNTTLDNLINKADLMDSIMDKNYICVIGNEKVIEENKKFFNILKPLKR